MSQYFPYRIDTDPTPYRLVEDSADTPFGTLYFVRSRRRRTSTATMFLHGIASTWTTWTPLLRAAAERGRPLTDLVLVDLPGFGRSEQRTDNLDAAGIGATLISLAQDLGYTEVRLVGHSMGGFLALDMAGRHPSVVTSVHIAAGAYFSVIEAVKQPVSNVFLSPVVSMAYWSQILLARTGTIGGTAVRMARTTKLLPLFLSGFLAHPWKADQTLLDSLVADMRPQSFLLAARNGVQYDPYTRWAAITRPIHAAFGDADRLVPPKDMANLRRVNGDARTEMVDDCAHFLHVERPAETLAALAL